MTLIAAQQAPVHEAIAMTATGNHLIQGKTVVENADPFGDRVVFTTSGGCFSRDAVERVVALNLFVWEG